MRLDASGRSNATQRPPAASTDGNLGSVVVPNVARACWMAGSKSGVAITSASLMLAFRFIKSRSRARLTASIPECLQAEDANGSDQRCQGSTRLGRGAKRVEESVSFHHCLWQSAFHAAC